jgi:hypothetical protein
MEDIVQNKEGKLLTNQTTVFVGITIRKTTLVRAATRESSVMSLTTRAQNITHTATNDGVSEGI